MKYLLLFFSCLSFSQVQKFITIDAETLEYISEVKFTLYAEKAAVYEGVTSKDSITYVPKNVVFDSIAFTKFNYKNIGFKKEALPGVVLLSKTVLALDEVIISSAKPKEILIGEQARFIKKRSNSIEYGDNFGLLFRDYDLKGKDLKRMAFYVEKVTYKTTYKIKFYAAHESGNFMTTQYLDRDELLFESKLLTLEKGTKNKVEVDLEDYDLNFNGKDIFVCLELQGYYDENEAVIAPEFKESTRLKFQISNLINYYAKTSDYDTKKLSDSFININAMLNRDFAYMFFKKPPKHELVAPAIVFYATKKKLSLTK